MAELIDWTLIVPVILLLSGFWLLTLGVIRMGKPLKYERSGFSTSALGITAVAVGGAWALFSFNWLYSQDVILLMVAGIAIVAALRRKLLFFFLGSIYWQYKVLKERPGSI